MTVPEYTPGDWYAVVAGGVVLLLAPSTPPEVVRDVWASAPERGGGLGAQLDALVRHGIGGLHPFAAVDLTSGAVQTALRGDVEVEVVRGTRAEVLAAPDVVSWSERAVGSADEVTVRVAGAGRGPALPIVSGVVRASRVRVRVADDAVAAPTDAPPVVQAATPVPVATAPAPDAPAARSHQHVVEPGEVVETGAPADPEPSEDELVDDGGAVRAVPAAEPVAEPAPGAEPEPVAEPTPEPVAEPTPEPAEDEDGAPEPGAEPFAWPPVTASAPDDAPPAPAPAPTPAPVAAPAPVLPGPASADDHDGLTILSGELASIRQNLPSWALSQTGEWPSGAVVPTPAPAPGAAGGQPAAAPAPGAVATSAPVPRLALSTGVRVPVDGVVLIGRAPQADRAPEGAEARLVTVPSPEHDISRTHAEVRLELGTVLVTDLYSTNGVTVSSGGLPPRRIAAGEPVVVRDGDVVDLGDGVTFTLEPGA